MQGVTTGDALALNITSSDRNVLTLRTVCSEAGLSMSTLRRLIKAGRGPRVIKLSERRLGIRRCDLEIWLAGNSTQGNS